MHNPNAKLSKLNIIRCSCDCKWFWWIWAFESPPSTHINLLLIIQHASIKWFPTIKAFCSPHIRFSFSLVRSITICFSFRSQFDIHVMLHQWYSAKLSHSKCFKFVDKVILFSVCFLFLFFSSSYRKHIHGLLKCFNNRQRIEKCQANGNRTVDRQLFDSV